MPVVKSLVLPPRTVKLDSEDYENIYLRIREKLWLFWAGLFTFFGGAGLLIAYISIGSATEAAVKQYVGTAGFAKSISDTTSSRLADLDARTMNLTDALTSLEKRAASTKTLPLSVSDHGISIVGVDGVRFNIESGSAKGGELIRFQSAFTRPPMVLITSTSNRAGMQVLEHPAIRSDVQQVTTRTTTAEAFQLPRSTSFASRNTFDWVAIGK